MKREFLDLDRINNFSTYDLDYKASLNPLLDFSLGLSFRKLNYQPQKLISPLNFYSLILHRNIVRRFL